MAYRANLANQRMIEDAYTDRSTDPAGIGFGQSVRTAFEGFRAEDISTSESNANTRFFGERNTTLDQMVVDGEIPSEVVEVNSYQVGSGFGRSTHQTAPDYHALAAWANENTGSQFDVDDSDMILQMKIERDRRQGLLANGSLAGELIGNMGAAMTDPLLLGLTLATAPLGGGAIPATAVRSLVARTALVEGAIGIATEIPIQGEVYDFKQRIDSPYTVEDAIANVLLAGGASAVLGGGIAFIGEKALHRVLSMKSDELDATVRGDTAGASQAEVFADDDFLPAADELRQIKTETGTDPTLGDHLDTMLGTEAEANSPVIKLPDEAIIEEARAADEPEFYQLSPEEREMMVPQEDGTERTLGDIADELEAGDDFDRKLESFTTCMLGGAE